MKGSRSKAGARTVSALKSAQKPRCVDLFAGAGGFSLAAIKAGFDVSAAVEIDKHACDTYRRNISQCSSKTRVYEIEIAQLHPDKIIDECFGDTSTCDLVLGGPPCQGFSVHRLKNAGKNDPRNSLIHTYFRFVSALRPKMFLMENVPGLLWSRHAFQLRRFYAEGERAGYNVMPPVTLDARDYGVPQRRKRVFILGIRKDFTIMEADWAPTASHARIETRGSEAQRPLWNNCSTVFRRAATDVTNESGSPADNFGLI